MQQQKSRVTEIQVRVDCNGCAQKIKKSLNGIHGIHDLRVDFDRQRITVIGWADPEIVVKAIKKTKKNATICSNVEVTSSSSKKTEQEPEPKSHVATTQPAQASEPTDTPTQHNASSQKWQNNLGRTEDVGEIHHQQPNYVGYGDRSAYHDSPVFLQEPMYVTHCYSNRYIPSSYVTEYECVRSSPSWQTHYNHMEHYNGDHQNGNVNIAALFSDDNPNACSIV